MLQSGPGLRFAGGEAQAAPLHSRNRFTAESGAPDGTQSRRCDQVRRTEREQQRYSREDLGHAGRDPSSGGLPGQGR